MDRTHSFGYWLKRRRKALDLTQAELAQQASCSLDLIRKLEADARRPSRQLAEKLAEVLGVGELERAAFVQAARAERAVDLLAVDAQPREQPPRQPPRNNLPAQLTTLLGREQQVASTCALLRRANVRLLVTLSGPGGIGKTRLSLQVAAELLDAFSDGVYFVDLAPIREPALVISQIATTLGVKEAGSQPLLATLKDYLRDRQTLLLLDNFEQAIDAAPLVAELLAAALQPRCWRPAASCCTCVASKRSRAIDGFGGVVCDLHDRIKQWFIYHDGNLVYSKVVTFLLVCITCVGTRNKKHLEFDARKQVLYPLVSGVLLLVLSVWLFGYVMDTRLYTLRLNTILYMVATIIGTVLVHVALDNIEVPEGRTDERPF